MKSKVFMICDPFAFMFWDYIVRYLCDFSSYYKSKTVILITFIKHVVDNWIQVKNQNKSLKRELSYNHDTTKWILTLTCIFPSQEVKTWNTKLLNS